MPRQLISLLIAAAALTGHPAPVRLLALGDSFTAGTGSPPERSFPVRLAARWRAAGRDVVLENLGVNGYSTTELIDEELPEVRAFAPTRVTLAIGANDLVRHPGVEAYRQALRKIFPSLVAAGVEGAKIWVLPQPDWALSPAAAELGSPATYAAGIAAYNAALREETKRAGATYIDLEALMEREGRAGEIAGDGLHPSADAYDAWAAELAKRDP